MLRCAVRSTRLGLRNSTTRTPFRYGAACLRTCPQAVLETVVEVDGRVARGYSGDCLPPGWFDKTPGVDYERQIKPILSDNCLECHSQDKRKGGLSLATYGDVLDGGKDGAVVRPGHAARSLIVARVKGEQGDRMPFARGRQDEQPGV